MFKLRYFARITFVCLTIVTLVFSEALSEPILIRFSHVVEGNTPKGIGAKTFQELVERRLGDRVRVEVYPASQKYTDEQAILGLMFGDVEMAAPSFPKFRRFTNKLQVFDLPFLFDDVAHIHRFQQSEAGQRLLESMAGRGIKGLRYWDNGMRVISANRPIRYPQDLKGLTFRIEPSNIFQEQYALLGAIATPMPFKRLPDALKAEVVDGYENAWSNILSRNMHLLRPYFTEAGHSYLGYMVVTRKSFWDGLPGDVRDELEIILDEVTAVVNDLAREKELSDKTEIVKSGTAQVTTLTENERKLWKAALMPVWQKFEQSIGVENIKAAIDSRTSSP